MNKKYFVLHACLIISTIASAAPAGNTPANKVLSFAPKPKALEFIANKGQWLDPSLFHVDVKDGGIFLENTSVTYVLGDPANTEKVHEYNHDKSVVPVLKYHAYKMIFEGAKTPSLVQGNDPQSVYYNYFL